MGRSRGGDTTKIHALVDRNGLPIELKLTPGQAHDGKSAEDMLAAVGKGTVLLADRGYDIDAIRQKLEEQGARANICPLEHRIVKPKFSPKASQLVALVKDESTLEVLPMAMLHVLRTLAAQLASVHEQIGELDRVIHAQHRASQVSRRLESIPGIGVIGATALAATVTDPAAFRSGRELAAWTGLVPRQSSTGGKERLGSISKQGDRYLRRLLVAGAMAVVQHARCHPDKRPWITRLLARKPAKVVAIAIANKTARIAWAIMSRGGTYRAPAPAISAAA